MKPCYLIIQINLEHPSVMPFESKEKMTEYVRSKFGDKTILSINYNVYFINIKEVKVNE